MSAMLLSFALSLLVAFFLLRPLLSSERASALAVHGELQALLDRKSRHVQLLKDLELDFSTSKITQQDYEQMKEALMLEFAQTLKQIDLISADKRHDEPHRL